MGEYRLSPRAERDLEEIWLYTEGRWSAAQPDSYLADRDTGALIDMIEELAVNPAKGRPVDDIRPGYRKQPAGARFIFYRQFIRASRSSVSCTRAWMCLAAFPGRIRRTKTSQSRPVLPVGKSAFAAVRPHRLAGVEQVPAGVVAGQHSRGERAHEVGQRAQR